MKVQKKVYSFRLDPDLVSKLDKIASGYERSRNYIVEKAIQNFLKQDEPLNEADKIIKEILNKNEN